MALTPRASQHTSALAQRQPRPNLSLRILIRPGVLTSLYTAPSRDVSAGAPQAPRVEMREANESDFTEAGTAEPGSQVAMPQWHRGVTN